MTDWARVSDSFLFLAFLPTLSVWPSTMMFVSGYCLSTPANSVRSFSDAGLSLALPVSNRMAELNRTISLSPSRFTSAPLTFLSSASCLSM